MALLTGEGGLIEVADMPTLPDGPACRPSISGALLGAIVRRRPEVAYVELVGPRPMDGAKAAFAFRAAWATVETVLAVLGVPQFRVTVPARRGG